MRQWWWSVLQEEEEEVASFSTQVQEGRQVSGTVKEWTLCVRAWVWVWVSDASMRRTQWCVCVFRGREGWEVRVSSQGWRCTESSSQSGLVIGVLSVSWSSSADH